MEALLSEEWSEGLDPLLVLDEASLSVVRGRVRDTGAAAAVPPDIVERACLVATEIGQNQLRHAAAGRVAVRPATRDGHPGIEVIGFDRGAGIADVAAALDAVPRSSGTLGVGVGAIRRLSTEVDFDVRLGEGTRIAARLFDREAPRWREVGVYGRPFPGERVSGDHAAIVHLPDALVLAVCDGLGHGPPAREAALRAIGVFRARAGEAVEVILEACHRDLGSTRGVVMTLARIARRGVLELTAVGNVETQVCAPRSARRFGGSSAVLGGRHGPAPRARTETTTLGPADVVVVTTDGISSKLSIEEDLSLLRMHPVAIAQRIVERFSRSNDDALVLVVR